VVAHRFHAKMHLTESGHKGECRAHNTMAAIWR
jgi:hypothetical protein